MVLANAWLGYLTWHQFGWRMHSRFGCDLRRKQAAHKLELFFITNRFRSLLKADVQFLLLVCANGVVIAIGRLLEQDQQRLEDGRGICIGMLVCCFAGLLLQYAWVRVCQAAVHTLDRSLEALATVTVGELAGGEGWATRRPAAAPLCGPPARPAQGRTLAAPPKPPPEPPGLDSRPAPAPAPPPAGGLAFWPLIMVYLVLLGRWPQTASGQATILVPLGVWLVLRLALWWHMKLLLGALEQPELREALSGGGDPDTLRMDDLPVELSPLMRGSWLVGDPGPGPAGARRPRAAVALGAALPCARPWRPSCLLAGNAPSAQC
jgi:hypothetical protein